MCKEVNVINKAEESLNVTVNDIDGNTQIIIERKENADLFSLSLGEVFKVDNVEYIVLDQLDGNQTAVIRKELLKGDMEFGDNNNWKTSSLREYLNGKYLEEIENAFGKDRIVEHTVNLLSLDGLDDYGTCEDKVSLLTIDQYREYRKLLGGNLNEWWWLVTPDSTPSGWSSRYVQCVGSYGRVRYCDCFWGGRGVRPFFILQS